MSLFNISIHPGFGVLSVDCLLSAQLDDEGMPMKAPEVTAHAAHDMGHPPAISKTHATKLVCLPHIQSVAVGAGSWAFWQIIANALMIMPCADIDDFPTIGRDALRLGYKYFCEQYGEMAKRMGVTCAIAGYSSRKKAVIGWAFSHLDGFEMTPVSGPATQPHINPDDPHVEMLRDLVARADANPETAQALHKEIAANQYRGSKSGFYPPGFHVSNEIHIATVSEREIKIVREFV